MACDEEEEEEDEEENEWILYGDANNLYGDAQRRKMPVGCYTWVAREEFEKMDWRVFDEDADMGYILEVDLIYPQHLHLTHNSLPLAPHRMDIDESHLSDYAKRCLLELRGKTKHRSRKLVSSFLPRTKYVVHAANLALYLELGMELTHIHRVMTFEQSDFLRQYIDLCTRKRSEAKTTFKKNLFKLFSNSCFGKFIEDSRKYLCCEIVTDKTKFEKLAESPRFNSFKVISQSGVVAVFLRPRTLVARQAWAIGFTILERSKDIIYSAYYKKIRPALDNKCSVIFTDTGECIKHIGDKHRLRTLLGRIFSPQIHYVSASLHLSRWTKSGGSFATSWTFPTMTALTLVMMHRAPIDLAFGRMKREVHSSASLSVLPPRRMRSRLWVRTVARLLRPSARGWERDSANVYLSKNLKSV